MPNSALVGFTRFSGSADSDQVGILRRFVQNSNVPYSRLLYVTLQAFVVFASCLQRLLYLTFDCLAYVNVYAVLKSVSSEDCLKLVPGLHLSAILQKQSIVGAQLSGYRLPVLFSFSSRFQLLGSFAVVAVARLLGK